MEQELGLLLEAVIADLQFRSLQRRMAGDVHMDHLSPPKLHEQEDIENTNANRVLHKEVAATDGLGLVFQEASPGLGISRPRRSLDHVSSDRGAGVANAELQLQLQGNAILAVLRMIGGYPADEIDVFIGNCRSACPALRHSRPELAKLPLPPSDHSLRSHEYQFRCPVPPNLRHQGPKQPISVFQKRFPGSSLVNGELVTEHQDSQPCRPIEPREDDQIESLHDRDQKQDLHAGRLEAKYPKVQQNQLGRSFRGARLATGKPPAMEFRNG